jgi:hypothetical protein
MVMSDQANDAAIAAMSVEIRHLGVAIDRLAVETRAIRQDVDELKTLAAKGGGAWGSLTVVGAAVSAIGWTSCQMRSARS